MRVRSARKLMSKALAKPYGLVATYKGSPEFHKRVERHRETFYERLDIVENMIPRTADGNPRSLPYLDRFAPNGLEAIKSVRFIL